MTFLAFFPNQPKLQRSAFLLALAHNLEKFLEETTLKLGFPTGRDSASFWDKGTEVPSLFRDKGTIGQAKNLTKGWDGPGQPKSGKGHGAKRDRAEKDVLIQKNDVLIKKTLF